MSNWNDGYVSDIGYTFGYYPELNPLRLRLAFLNQGLVFPEVGVACELGFGQGLSANIHAAASMTNWHGTDFNPSQAGFAQELASIAGAGARLFDQAFAEFVKRSDLPEFDYIGLHGIWSWISDENRQVIVDFVRNRLKVGGVLYVSYNTLPGWAAFAPMRHLMTEHAEVLGSEGRGLVSRINGAMDFAEKLLATNPLFNRANPLVGDRLQKMKEQNRHYLAHEYFNRDWDPMHFATMGKWLDGAKVQYACSANCLDHIDSLHLSDQQQAFLKEIPDPMFRESTRDFMVNQQFRRDYWVKGARRFSTPERTEALRQVRICLSTHRADVSLQVTRGRREATLSEKFYRPLLDLLSDHKPKTVGQIEQALKGEGITLAQIIQPVVLLSGAGHLQVVQDDLVIAKAEKQTERLNVYLLRKAHSSNDIVYLASPVTGGGFNVNRFEQLFLTSLSQGEKTPSEWAKYAWGILAAQGQRLQKEGTAIESVEDNLAELTAQAAIFAQKQLPILKALRIVTFE